MLAFKLLSFAVALPGMTYGLRKLVPLCDQSFLNWPGVPSCSGRSKGDITLRKFGNPHQHQADFDVLVFEFRKINIQMYGI